MGFENTLAQIPGLGGYLAKRQFNDQQGMNELTQASGAMGVLSKLQAQQEAMQMKEVLTTSKSLEDATAKLMRLGSPAAIKTAQELMQMQDTQTKLAQGKREATVFSPENLARNMIPGSPAITPDPQEFEQSADQGTPVPVGKPAVAPQINIDAIRQQAALTGPKGLEAYSTHIAGEQDRRLKLAQLQQTAQQNYQLRLQQAKNQADRDAALAEFRKESLDVKRMMAGVSGEIARGNQDLRRLQIEQMGQNKASADVQKLSAALDRANLPEADAVLSAVEKSLNDVPDLASYLSGAKSMIPDIVVSNIAGSKDIVTGRQAFQKLFNITLKNRSGAAVTLPEFERLKAEFANGIWKTPEQLKAGVEQARNIVQKHYASVAAGFGPKALEAYNESVKGMGGNVVIEGKKPDPLGIR